MTDVMKANMNSNSQRFLVSLDAHKRTYFAKIVDSRTDKVLFNSGIVGTIKNVIDRLEMLKLAKKETTVLYEAGTFVRKMQDRLNSRHRHLRGRGKHINKVRCAIARELIMFLWEYSTKIIPELEFGTVKSKKAA